MSNKKNLRFAVLIDSFSLKRWQSDSILHLIESKQADLICFIKNAGELIYQANKHSIGFRYLERRIRNSGPLEMTELKLDFKDIEVIEMTPQKKGISNVFTNEDLSKIKDLNLDFILRFGFGIIKGDILHIPRLGVWSFHHGDPKKYRGGPAAFWEIMKGETSTGSILQQLTEKLDGGKILKEGFLKTTSHNYKDHVHQLLNESKFWPTQVVKSILLNNNTLQSKSIETSAPIYKTPSNLQTLWFLVIEFFNKLKFHYQDLFQADKWNIGIIDAPIEYLIDNEIEKVNWFKEIGNNKYIADPFANPINPEQILCEEYNYKNQKGSISCYLDSGNKKGEVISKDYHLSYPFSFKNGESSYIIPESYENNELCIYEIKDNKIVNSTKILSGKWIDPTLIHDGDYWWLFCTEKEKPNENLFLFYSKSLEQDFQAHPLNPIVTDICSARPAGTPFKKGNTWYRLGQNCSQTYGGSVQIKQIEKISPTDYKETFVKEIKPIKGKYDNGLHTLSPFGNKTLIDGKRLYFNFWHLKNQLNTKLKRRFSS